MIHNHLDIPQVYFHSEQGDPEGKKNSTLSTIDHNPLLQYNSSSYGVTNSTKAIQYYTGGATNHRLRSQQKILADW